MNVPEVRTVADVLDALPASGNVLVAGAGRETLGRFPVHLLRAAVGVDDAALLVTTEDAGDRLRRRVTDPRDGPDRSRVGVVDATPTGRRRVDRDANVWHASSPVDFNGAGGGIDRCYDRLEADGRDAVHLLYDTLTTPFLSADSETVVRFAHHVALQADDRTGIGLFPVHTNVTTERDVAHLKHLFDALVEVRKRGGGRQVRCSGVDGDWCNWYDLPEGDAVGEFTGVV